MNTTTNIHLAHRLITIDVDAWQQLQNYLTALKTYFSTQESGDEIYTDIESRIAEIMEQQLKRGKVSISAIDVTQIIQTVGTLETLAVNPEEIKNSTKEYGSANTTNTQQQQQQNQNAFTVGPKKLVRNGNDKLVSGLCSGVANYLNVDPIWVRLVFFLFIFPGGIGLLLYIIGSIIVPKSYDTVFQSKRLFRDDDNKVFGGVCAGIAKYFYTNPLYVRLLFLLPTILALLLNRVYRLQVMVPHLR